MSKAYLFAIFLLAASFTGCIGGEDLEKITTEKEETTEEEEEKGTIDPVGEDNMTSLRKEIDDLKETIKNYEKPKVYFMMDDDNDHLFYNEYGESYYILAIPYDIDGVIERFKWESSDPNFGSSGDNCDLTTTSDGECLGWFSFMTLSVCDYEENQTFTVTVYDNDGNSASASYDYVYSEDLCGSPE